MKAYIILTHYEATPKNTNFFGTEEAVKNFFTGKGWTNLPAGRPNEVTESDVQKINHWQLQAYAFTTKASAMRGLKAHKEHAEWEEGLGWWKVSCKLIEVTI